MRTRIHQLSSPNDSRDTSAPVPSTWPWTMWPLSRPEGESGRSRFTLDPAWRSPRLLRRRVSGARSAEKEAASRSTAVRQTPLTAMLDPWRESSRTVEHWILRRAPSPRRSTAATVPNSSMIPVNIGLHGELVRSNVVQSQVAHADSVGAAPSSGAAGHRQRLRSSQDLGAVVEEY